MTKAEIKTIQQQEAKLWLDLNEYQYYCAPDDGDDAKRIEWENTDRVYHSKLSAWCAVSNLMDALKIESDNELQDMETAFRYSTELFLRRQAAQGIFYE